MKTVFGFILIVVWLISCFGVVKAAVESDQDSRTTTILYIAFMFLFFFGGTGLYVMFG